MENTLNIPPSENKTVSITVSQKPRTQTQKAVFHESEKSRGLKFSLKFLLFYFTLKLLICVPIAILKVIKNYNRKK